VEINNEIDKAFTVIGNTQRKPKIKRDASLLNSTLVSFRLKPLEKEQFQNFCYANRVAPTDVLREFVLSLIHG
jgi:hypothetical protein